MKASEHIRLAIQEIGRTSSPWRPELQLQLRHLRAVAIQHESWVESPAPMETALGHKPRRTTVAGHSVATDRALEVLCESD